MTTIAFRDGMLAADSRESRSDWTQGNSATKILRGSDGRLIALCGDYAAAWTFAQWLKQPKSKRKTGKFMPENRGAVIEVFPSGKVIVHQDGGTHPAKGPFLAWGSGFPAALAAMHMGADPVTAIRIASKVDGNTGGRIRSLRLSK